MIQTTPYEQRHIGAISADVHRSVLPGWAGGSDE